MPEGALLPLDRGSAGHILRSGESPANRRTKGAGPEWIESIGEREAGVASVSAGVRAADGTVVAAVSVSGPIERLSRRPGQRFGPAVVAAARSRGGAPRGLRS